MSISFHAHALHGQTASRRLKFYLPGTNGFVLVLTQTSLSVVKARKARPILEGVMP